MGRFTLPRDLYWGKGALENLKTLKGKKGCSGFRWRLYEAFLALLIRLSLT